MIIGRGKERENLLQLAQALGVAEDVALLGFIEQPYAYIAHASVLAFTSLWEGLGFVPIEALALGTPVVATDCPSGPREILQDGRYGALITTGDAAALATALAQTLDNPLPDQILREAARPYAISAATDAYLRAMNLPLTLMAQRHP
jgi:glycosyltransferase involved in cell wall biosynthesis